MKLQKTLIAAVALGAFAGAAQAQSSVTLYGIADAGLLYVNNVAVSGKNKNLFATSTANSSRWGMRGVEDLGGGLSAIFTLESGYTISNGTSAQGGLLFGRKAYVGLTSTQFGTLTMGRQYSVSNDFTAPFASGADWAASGLGYGTHAGDVDNVDTSNRIANSVKYETPSIQGLQAGVLYSLGGVAGQNTAKEVIDGGVAYSNGPIKLGAAYNYTKNPNFATFGDQGNSSATGVNMSNPIYKGYASAGFQQIVVAGGSYTVGPATLGAEYSNTKFGNLGTTVVTGATVYNGGEAIFNSAEVNVKYFVTPALMLAGAYIYTHNSGADNAGSAKYNQFNLGAVYSLSKRTSLYANAFYETASGTDSTKEKAVAALGTVSATSKQFAAIIGMTHRF